jgi:carbonic anhydrase/acetyltransferase-like protein (isoleucine patch superfamily)
MRDLIILGTQVHAHEMAEIVERVNRQQPTWKLLGHICPEACLPGTTPNGYDVLGGPEALAGYPGAFLVPVEGFPRLPDLPRDRLVSLIDPSAFVSRSASIGVGCVVYPNCYIGLKATIGDWLFCLSGSIINHDCVLEEQVTVCSGVRLAGHVHVEQQCYLGQGCNIKQFLRIGRASLVGMGSVVTRDVAPGSVVTGCPARRVRERAGYER